MAFPATPLKVTCELSLAGTWTDITGYSHHSSWPVAYTVTRGRANEGASSAVPQQCALQLANTDGRFSPRNPAGPYYPSLTRNTPLRISVPDSGTYLRLADDATSSATAPDSAGLQITGSIDIRVDLNLDNWTPSVLAAKWGATTSLQAWALTLNADGSVTLIWWDGSTVHQVSCSGLAVMPLGRSMIRATLNTATGTVQFFTAATMGTGTLLASITGSGATSVGAAAGQAVSVGDAAQVDASFGTHGPQGKVYEFQLYNGIGGTLKADPVFTAQTAGAASFADAQGNTWTVNGTAVLSGRAYRFHGELRSMPQSWDVTGHDVWTPASAAGPLMRLQQGSAPVRSVMRRGIPAWPSVKSSTMTSLSSLPSTIAYWPAEDNAGAQQVASGLAHNTDGVVVPAMMVAGTAGFQGAAGSPAADGVFACSAALAQVQSSAWTGRVPAYSSNGTAAMCTFLLAIPSGGAPNNTNLIQLNWSGGQQLLLQYSTASGGSLNAASVAAVQTVFGSVTGVNGNGYMIQLSAVTTGTPTVFWNAIKLGRGQSQAQASTTLGAASGQLTSVVVNPQAAALGATETGHIWVQAAFSSAGTQDALPSMASAAVQNLLNAYSGEAAGTRFARVCAENGFASRVYGYPAVTQAMGAQPVDTLVNILQDIEDTDRGQVFESRNALALGYRTLASLCNQGGPAFTADLGLDEVSPPLAPVDDDQLTRNDIVVTRSGGSAVQYQVTSGPLSVNAPPGRRG